MHYLSITSKPNKKTNNTEDLTELTKSGWGKKIANARALAKTNDVTCFSETYSTPAESDHFFFRHVAQKGNRDELWHYHEGGMTMQVRSRWAESGNGPDVMFIVGRFS